MPPDGTPTDMPGPATVAARAGPRWAVRLAAGLVVVGGLAAGYFLWLAPDRPPGKPPLPDLAELNEDPEDRFAVHNPGYLGPQSCAPCHAARVAEFLRTPHARACRRPRDGPMPPGFDPGRGHYATGDPDLYFDMTREGGEYFQTGVHVARGGIHRTKNRIDLVYGANKADEVFFTWRGDRLFELMTVWVHPTDQWANTSYDRYGVGTFNRETTTRCLECHTTWFAHVPGTSNQYRPESLILGTTCEKCHGPGRDHVEYHRANPKAEDAHAIVHPGHLSRDRLTEVCTQCHSNAVKPRGPANSYRPGEPLDAHYRTAQTRYPEQDHVANQIKYLRESKCYQKSETLTCVTCHDPHRPHEKADAATAHRSCAQCHKPDACTDRPRLPAAVRDDCVGCHMRQQVWMNVHFHTAVDRYLPPIRRYQHRIGIDRIARSEVLLAWHRAQPGDGSRAEAERLATELAQHWLAEVERRRKEHRFLGAIGAAREILRLDPPGPLREKAAAALRDAIALQTKVDTDLMEALHQAEEQRPASAIEILNRALAVKPDYAVAHSKLGALYAATGRRDRAVEHLEAVAKHDPDMATGLTMLGWLAYLDGRWEDSIGFYRRAEEIEPYDAKINYHIGLALLKLDRWAEADERFRRVIAIDPQHAGGFQGLAEALRRQQKPAEAVRYAWRAGKLTEFREPDVLVTLAEVYSAARRNPEAAAAAAKALEADAAAEGRPRLGFEVRQRLLGMQARTRN